MAGVTTFTDTGSISPATGFRATINWGDGSPSSTGIIGGSAGSYTVSGSHTYQEFGSYNASVTVNDAVLPVNTATSTTGTVNVADAALAPGQQQFIQPQEINQPFTTEVAAFSDADTYSPASEFADSTISWGDGNTGTVGDGDLAIYRFGRIVHCHGHIHLPRRRDHCEPCCGQHRR